MQDSLVAESRAAEATRKEVNRQNDEPQHHRGGMCRDQMRAEILKR